MTEIILENFSSHPHCQHGPTVLFSRRDTKQQYYSCSAYRSKKLCPFYLEASQKPAKVKNKDNVSKKRNFHNELSVEEFSNPENNKGQAQYLFSDSTLEFLNDIFNTFKIINILSIGTPSIHELHKNASFLLDIDRKFETGVPNFARYNMCNHHFFNNSHSYLKFLKNSKNLLVICDPPFGARLELIMNTFNLVKKDWSSFKDRGNINFILINPYFSEGKIKKIDPNFNMSDYRISYATHKKFKKDEKSPVRFFTTLNLSKISLPSDSYKFCPPCQKYVFLCSQHCKFCNICDSKDGKPYFHCSYCNKCAKKTWSHCHKCSFCHLQGQCNSERKRKCYDSS